MSYFESGRQSDMEDVDRQIRSSTIFEDNMEI